jgi:hypothetical protein
MVARSAEYNPLEVFIPVPKDWAEDATQRFCKWLVSIGFEFDVMKNIFCLKASVIYKVSIYFSS